jgi:methionine sulfoxide reductase catalytic subunit
MSRDDLPQEPNSAEITPERFYAARRELIKNSLLFAATATAFGGALTWLTNRGRLSKHLASQTQESLPEVAVSTPIKYGGEFDTTETKTPFDSVTTYNNFYEFGTSKSDPVRNAHTLKPRPWTLTIEGECSKPQTLDIDDLTKLFALEERIYRMRCVEAWSMVIPWLGFPLGKLLERVQPTSKAKFVAFTTLHDTEQMPYQKRGDSLNWPYIEGLRLDEAMHPLTMLAVGLYGKALPNQNGAPVRLVVPWKYGFKGIKSIVHIRLTDWQPMTSWNLAQSREYGFYANVNPEVPHPRWSQAREERIGDNERRPTLMFNGYAEHVAQLYKGMDLEKNF